MFNQSSVLQQAQQHESFYLYDESQILKHTSQLNQNFSGVEFLYSIKANPNPMVVKTVFNQGLGADAASLAEVLLSNKLGIQKDKVYYSAPGKSTYDLENAIDYCTIIVDSLTEVQSIQKIAAQRGIVVEIGVRINPNFTFYKQSGISSKFGIDAEILFENLDNLKQLQNVKIIGLHVHVQSQELKADVLEKYYENMFALSISVQEKLGSPLQFLNFGSGLGISYSQSDVPLDIVTLGNATTKLVQTFKEQLPHARIFIETGRFVVSKSGVYVTRVLDKKVSRETTYIILSNTLNGFIRPSMIQMFMGVAADGEELTGLEPLFTSKNAFEFLTLKDTEEYEIVTLTGNLCTSADVIAKDIRLPKLVQDDLIVITNAGSYAAVLSPMQFASMRHPAQLFLKKDGSVVDATEFVQAIND